MQRLTLDEVLYGKKLPKQIGGRLTLDEVLNDKKPSTSKGGDLLLSQIRKGGKNPTSYDQVIKRRGGNLFDIVKKMQADKKKETNTPLVLHLDGTPYPKDDIRFYKKGYDGFKNEDYNTITPMKVFINRSNQLEAHGYSREEANKIANQEKDAIKAKNPKGYGRFSTTKTKKPKQKRKQSDKQILRQKLVSRLMTTQGMKLGPASKRVAEIMKKL